MLIATVEIFIAALPKITKRGKQKIKNRSKLFKKLSTVLLCIISIYYY
tara:strand:+ start:192 stop:335 length:144 start_codon:yes stop_codon:yes gene_type:complete